MIHLMHRIMKKINAIAWLITMMMTLAGSQTVAATGTNYEVEVGKTLTLDISDLGVECMANGSSYTWEITQAYVGDDTDYTEYLTFTSKSKNYAIVKGVKAGKLVGIQYTGYYYSNGTRKTFYDAFYVRVVNSGTPSTGPASLEVFPTPQTIKVGETKWVYVTQTRAIGGTYFYSEDETIATVTRGELASEGSYTTAAQITAKKAGKVNIVAKNVNGLTDICEVTVPAQEVSSVSIKSSLTLEIGETYTFTPTIYPSGAETSYTWTSDKSSVASVSSSGKVSAKSAGTATIKVTTDNGKTATCKVTVNAVTATEYDVSYNVYENGKVMYNGTPLTGYDSFKVVEGSDVALTIVPDEGYKIGWVWIDYEDVKDQLVDNVLTIRNIKKDMYLLVSFDKSDDTGGSDSTGDNQPDEPATTTENAIALGNVTANTGTTVSFPVSLTNKDEITALQMDLHLPTGITLAADEEGDARIETTDRVSSKHTVDCSKMADGSYRIICYSTKNSSFTGNSGTLFNLMLNVEANVGDGDYEVTATGIELSDVTGTAYKGKDAKGIVTVKSYMLGDVDGNGQHSINDVVCIINHVLNRTNSTFVEAAADLDGNGDITVNDAVLVIKTYILGQSSNARQATRAAATDGENYISIEDLKMQPGEVKTVEVLMTNERDDIRGLQCDITLPSGISFLYDEDAEDYVSAAWRIPRKLSLSSEKQDENTLRVAGVCTGASSIYGNSGTVFTFKVKADENIMAGMYQIKLSNVELSYGEAIGVADRTSSLEITKSTSGIESLSTDTQQSLVIYDLRGQRVDASKAKNGVFIVNGKKVIIK